MWCIPDSHSRFEQLCQGVNTQLSWAIWTNPGYALQGVMSPIKPAVCSLRPWAHNRILPIADNIAHKTFAFRMIYS